MKLLESSIVTVFLILFFGMSAHAAVTMKLLGWGQLMNDWFINKMMEAHNEQRWDDRRNYAKAASVDFIKMIYFREEE